MRDYKFKVANMAKEQEFSLYPYDGGDTILLQSDKRFAQVNLRTGDGIINGSNKNYANSIALLMNPVKFILPEPIKIQIQEFLWNNNGKDGNISNIIHFENKPLFTK
jgi:hypothetical protein